MENIPDCEAPASRKSRSLCHVTIPTATTPRAAGLCFPFGSRRLLLPCSDTLKPTQGEPCLGTFCRRARAALRTDRGPSKEVPVLLISLAEHSRVIVFFGCLMPAAAAILMMSSYAPRNAPGTCVFRALYYAKATHLLNLRIKAPDTATSTTRTRLNHAPASGISPLGLPDIHSLSRGC